MQAVLSAETVKRLPGQCAHCTMHADAGEILSMRRTKPMELVCAPAIIGEGASRPPRSFAAPQLCRLHASRQLGKVAVAG